MERVPDNVLEPFITGRSMVVLLLWFDFIQVIPITSFMLHDFVATRISFGCSLSPLNFTCSVQASTVTTLRLIAARPGFRYAC